MIIIRNIEENYSNSKRTIEIISTPVRNGSDADEFLKGVIEPLESFGIKLNVIADALLIDGAYKLVTYFSLRKNSKGYSDTIFTRNKPDSIMDSLKVYLNKFGIYVYQDSKFSNKWILSNEFLSKDDIREILQK
jgi:hypothetical protein